MSEFAEERVEEAEFSPSTTDTEVLSAGVWIRSAAGGPFRRGVGFDRGRDCGWDVCCVTSMADPRKTRPACGWAEDD